MTESYSSRQRLLKTLQHQEPDRVPLDLASTQVTGITDGAYRNLRKHLGLGEDQPAWADVIQQLVLPGEDVLDRLNVDTRGLFPLTSSNWDVYEKLTDAGEYWSYFDEWRITHHFPKQDGHWFSMAASPLEDVDPETTTLETLDYPWPCSAEKQRVAGLRALAADYRARDKAVVLRGFCAGIFEMTQRLRGMQNAMIDTLAFPEFSDSLAGRLADIKIAFWEMALDELGDLVDVVIEADDFGTQESQLISPDQFRKRYKPHEQRVLAAIKARAPHVKILFHSCGSVREIIPDLIEIGVDILNPVHITAAGMEPKQLKKDFGGDLCFWGGGVNTQGVLPQGSPQDVADDVRRNLDALAPGGGYVFNTIHNIQSEVPPENIMAMWDALQQYGVYN